MFFMQAQHKWDILWNAKEFFIWIFPIESTYKRRLERPRIRLSVVGF
jgi:hypothetical protein